VQPQLILLQKTLVQIEGLGRVLYPDLDLWQTGKPVLKAWMIEQTGPRATLRRLRREWPDLRYALEKLPLVARRLVDVTLDERPAPATPWSGARPGTAAGDRSRSLHGAIAGAALLVSAAVWLGLDTPPGWVGWVAGAGGLLTLWRTRPKI
ncbi:MAG: ubiquinone biosynthesis regulatory protein kinase UbiB, partial [Gammaproteobacteria bacterium]